MTANETGSRRGAGSRRVTGDPSHRGPIRRFDAVLGGPIWWACHLAGMYWWVPRACATGALWPFHLLTVVLLVLTARAALSGIQLQRAGRAAPEAPGAGRDVYLGWAGVAFSIFFGAVILAEWLPVASIDPCV